jgi:hypothetical protein
MHQFRKILNSSLYTNSTFRVYSDSDGVDTNSL